MLKETSISATGNDELAKLTLIRGQFHTRRAETTFNGGCQILLYSSYQVEYDEAFDSRKYSIQKLVLREFAVIMILSRERYKVQVSKRKTTQNVKSLPEFVCLFIIKNFKCKPILLSETAISETGKDKFGKLPLENSKSWPTLIRGQCYISEPEIICSDQVQILQYFLNIKLNTRKHSTAVKLYKKGSSNRICIHSQSREGQVLCYKKNEELSLFCYKSKMVSFCDKIYSCL